MPYQALYYPFIHFRDEDWLRTAVLYWDRVGRIVPSHSFQLEDSPLVRGLLEAGAVVEFSPADTGANHELGEPFLDLVSQYADRLREHFAVALVNEWPHRQPNLTGPEGRDPRLGYVSLSKMDFRLVEALTDAGLAHHDSRNGWIGIHPRLASVYMTALADVMGRNHAASPVTDSPVHAAGIGGIDLTRLASLLLPETGISASGPRPSEVEDLLLRWAVRAVVPTGLDSLSVAQILSIREQYAVSRTKFHEGVGRVVTGLPDLSRLATAAEIDWHLRNLFASHIEAPLQDVRDELRRSKIEFRHGIIGGSATLPPLFTMVFDIEEAAPAALASGLAWSVYGAYRAKQARDQDTMRNRWPAYLLQLENGTTPKSALQKVVSAARSLRPRR